MLYLWFRCFYFVVFGATCCAKLNSLVLLCACVESSLYVCRCVSPMSRAIRQPCDHHDIVQRSSRTSVKGMYMSRLTVALAACTMDVSRICQEVPSNKSQGSANELIDHPEATRDASCKPILSPGINSWSQQIANPGGPRGQASASTQKLNPKG